MFGPAIEQLQIFKAIPKMFHDTLLMWMKPRAVPALEILHCEGETSEEMYCVLQVCALHTVARSTPGSDCSRGVSHHVSCAQYSPL